MNFLFVSIYLGGGFIFEKYLYPYLGQWSDLTTIFETGWNHQLDLFM